MMIQYNSMIGQFVDRRDCSFQTYVFICIQYTVLNIYKRQICDFAPSHNLCENVGTTRKAIPTEYMNQQYSQYFDRDTID